MNAPDYINTVSISTGKSPKILSIISSVFGWYKRVFQISFSFISKSNCLPCLFSCEVVLDIKIILDFLDSIKSFTAPKRDRSSHFSDLLSVSSSTIKCLLLISKLTIVSALNSTHDNDP